MAILLLGFETKKRLSFAFGRMGGFLASNWGRNGLDEGCEALTAYRGCHRLVNHVTLNTTANPEFALAA